MRERRDKSMVDEPSMDRASVALAAPGTAAAPIITAALAAEPRAPPAASVRDPLRREESGHQPGLRRAAASLFFVVMPVGVKYLTLMSAQIQFYIHTCRLWSPRTT